MFRLSRRDGLSAYQDMAYGFCLGVMIGFFAGVVAGIAICLTVR
jgi:hypothetical protein